MTFLDDLERELRDAHPRRRAARRKAAAARVVRRAPAGLAVVAALGGGIALVGALDSSEERPAAAPATTATTPAPSVRGVRVAVLNGTTAMGLARAVADRLAAEGASLGTISNAAQQDVRRTRVLHREAHEAQGDAVAALLEAPVRRVLDASTSAVAGGDADVVVVVGSDQEFPAAAQAETVGCPRVGAEQTAPSVVASRGDVSAGPLAILGARGTVGRRRDAFRGRGYKLAVTVADGSMATLRVPRALNGRVGLVYTLRAQDAAWRLGVRAASRTVDFVACSQQPGGSPRTGWPGGIVTDRPRCATLLVKVLGERRSRRLRVPLGRAC